MAHLLAKRIDLASPRERMELPSRIILRIRDGIPGKRNNIFSLRNNIFCLRNNLEATRNHPAP